MCVNDWMWKVYQKSFESYLMQKQQLNKQVNLFGTLWVLMLANHSLRVEEEKKVMVIIII